MTSLEEAVQLILQHVIPMKTETRPLIKSRGYVLADDIHSTITLPTAPIGGPDGYAVQAADIASASRETPAILRIIGTSRAGHPANKHVVPGTAIRIMTGSVVPAGANCVIPFEETDEPENKNGPNLNNPKAVKIFKTYNEGDNIRQPGGAIQQGELLLSRGTCIGPHQISALSAIGVTKVKVIRQPVIGVIPTGDELVKAGSPLPLGKVYDSNGPAIISFIEEHGGIAKYLGFARDKEGMLEQKLIRATDFDAIITSGGVSKGDYDLVRLVLAKHGEIVFARIRLGPGAAVVFSMLNRSSLQKDATGTIPVFSLSGPPAGCLVNLETLVLPALRKMRGLTNLQHARMEASMLNAIPNKRGFTFAKWSQLQINKGEYQLNSFPSAPFGNLESIANANALALIGPDNSPEAGDSFSVLPLRAYQDNLPVSAEENTLSEKGKGNL